MEGRGVITVETELRRSPVGPWAKIRKIRESDIRERGRKVEFPKQLFSRLLLAQPYSAMSSYTSRTTRQNTSNANAESTLVRGVGFANQQHGSGDHYRY